MEQNETKAGKVMRQPTKDELRQQLAMAEAVAKARARELDDLYYKSSSLRFDNENLRRRAQILAGCAGVAMALVLIALGVVVTVISP